MSQVKTSAAILSREPYKLYIRVEGDLPKSANAFLGRNPWPARDHAKKWKMIIGNIAQLFLPEELLEYAQVSITRHSSRTLDFDNCVTSMKPIVDGLKDLIIVDDSWSRIGAWKVKQEFRAKGLGPMLEIWVTEVDELAESRH